MSKVDIELNHTRITELLKSQEMMTAMKGVAENMPGKIEKSYVGFDRVHVIVKEDM